MIRRTVGAILARAAITRAIFVATLVVVAAPLAAAEMTPTAALERLFREQPAQADWFAPSFLSQVPHPQIDAILRQVQAAHGALVGIEPSGQGFIVRLQRAEVATQIALDAQGQIVGLFFQPPIPTGGGIDSYVQAIAAIPGKSSILVLSGDRRRAAHEPDAALGVASAFKLAVLKAVADRVSAGALAWDQVVRLDPAWRSLPTGILQDWPDGTPLTVATAADLMISLSDNTAADGLIHLVGREAVEALAPRNRPFLTTRELFILKSNANAELRRRWSEGDEAARRAMLDDIAALPLPAISDLMSVSILDIDWFFTPGELCDLLKAVHELPAFGIYAGQTDPAAWAPSRAARRPGS
jgi:beta-lactamase class A